LYTFYSHTASTIGLGAGLSNFNSVQIDNIIQKGSIVPAINQVELTLLLAAQQDYLQVEVHPYMSQSKLRLAIKQTYLNTQLYSNWF
jgi:hypothetical protein